MERGNLSRRGFLEKSLLGLTAAGLPLWYARELVAAEDVKNVRAKAPGANDRLVMAAIGIGSPKSRGRAIYNEARKQPGVMYKAACDVDARDLKNALDMMKKDGFTDAVGFEDFRKCLEDKDINAVTIATPDHWHALVAIEAMKQGKDVYCEKPLTLTIAEGRALVEVARKTERVFQTGSQQRSEMRGMFRLACELVRNGRIGKVKSIECRIGDNPVGTFKKAPVPEGLNWDFWLGPTPKVDYVPERCHYEFRWWYDYSGGKMTDWGAHHLDIAQWALGMDGSGPKSVRPLFSIEPNKAPNSYNCHPQFVVEYEYPNGTRVLACNRGATNYCPGDGNGVVFEGENGKWIFVSRGQIKASDPKLIDEPLPKDAVQLYEGRTPNHMANFMECVKTRKRPICDVAIGHSSATVCHLGAIALRLGKKLTWDPKAEKFGQEEANKMLSRPYREPWKLEI